jgi:2-enoate reductase
VKGPYSAGVLEEEFAEAGRDINEGLQMARMLEEAGFDALHVDAGAYDSWYWAHPPGYLPYGCLAELAEAAKKEVDIPVIGVGRLDYPQVAVNVVEEGKMDVAAIGRGLLADPFWVRKLEREQTPDIRPCIGCHDGCLDRIFQGKPLSCAVNPSTGRERIYRLQRSEKPGKVMVVGGGVAGLEAARVAALRGHGVELFEKTDLLGGHLIEATVPDFKEDLGRLLTWYERQLETLNISITFETEMTHEQIGRHKADAVIMATGSDPVVPEIPGLTKELAVTVIDVFRKRKSVGGEVMVIGGGLVGCETALWLAQQGKKVCIVEVLPEVMMGVNPVPYVNRTLLLDLLNFNRIEILTNQTLSEVNGNQVMLVHNETGQARSLSFESLVFATGFAPQRKLYDDVIGITPSLYLIGDARNPRNVMGAIWDAYEVARTL